jgi:prepilin peptidase CpaA
MPPYWPTLALLTVASVTDLTRREIPHVLPVAICLIGVAGAVSSWTGVGILGMALGCLAGFVAGLVFYALGGLAGGDVKLLAAVGTVCGWPEHLAVLMYTGLFGGVLALIARWRGQSEYAYAPAIAMGYLLHVTRGSL